eukprot:363577-Chlamydomonas_euryale.AAC.10
MSIVRRLKSRCCRCSWRCGCCNPSVALCCHPCGAAVRPFRCHPAVWCPGKLALTGFPPHHVPPPRWPLQLLPLQPGGVSSVAAAATAASESGSSAGSAVARQPADSPPTPRCSAPSERFRGADGKGDGGSREKPSPRLLPLQPSPRRPLIPSQQGDTSRRLGSALPDAFLCCRPRCCNACGGWCCRRAVGCKSLREGFSAILKIAAASGVEAKSCRNAAAPSPTTPVHRSARCDSKSDACAISRAAMPPALLLRPLLLLRLRCLLRVSHRYG